MSSPPADRAGLFFKPVIHVLIIVLLAFLAYSNTFQSPFQWDEAEYIVENPVIKDLVYFKEPSLAEGLPFSDAFKSRYIGYLTFALNYKVHGFDVTGYHIVNLLIHLINAVLVYVFVLFTFRTPFFRIFESRSQKSETKNVTGETERGSPQSGAACDSRFAMLTAFFTALLFATHPIQTEAVTYIFQRLASLVSLFYLLSLVLYIKGRLISQRQVEGEYKKNAAVAFYFLSLLSAILAMKTKENAFTLPVVIMFYEFLFFTGPVKPRVVRLLPFLFTMLIIPITIMGSGSTAGEVISQVKDPASLGYQEISRSDYFLTQLRVLVTYIRLLIFPAGQNLDHDFTVYRSFLSAPVFLSFLFLLALVGTGGYLYNRSRLKTAAAEAAHVSPSLSYYRLIAFGILWFFVTLSVESSIIPIPMVIDEYRMYLPSLGFFLAITTGVALLVQRSLKRSFDKEKMVVSALVVIVLALVATTYARNSVWKDKVSLWGDVVRKNPSSPRGPNNLGLAFEERGLIDQAIEQYRVALRRNPGFPAAHLNLGVALERQGQLDEAIEQYQIVLKMNPEHWRASSNLGSAYGKKGLTDKAIDQLEAAVKLNPSSASAHNNLGNAYGMKGSIDKAIEQYQTALKLNPDHVEAYFNLGNAYDQKGVIDRAIEQYRSAVRLRPDYVTAHYNLGRAYTNAGRLDKAIEHLRTAVRLRPENPSYRNVLGVLYGQKGLIEEAIEQFNMAIRLAPNNPAYRQNLDKASGLKSVGDKQKDTPGIVKKR